MVVISGYRIGNLRPKCDLAGHIYCIDVTCRVTPSTILQIYNLDGEKMEQKSSILTLYSKIKSEEIKWIWYPYIPVGKITLLQGDPGDGKSSFMMHVIAEISKGGTLPDGTEIGYPRRVIYQCSEDGAKDTIKPRLEACGADCNNIAFLDEEIHSGLTLDDERIRKAIIEFRPWMVVIDPLQSYIESNSDLMMAAKARRLMKSLGLWASTYDCAIVLLGHLNKSEGSKGLYRGLGSIDVVAAARSILQIERQNDIRCISQIKNNLAPRGKSIRFRIDKNEGFKWLESDDNEEMESEGDAIHSVNKHELAAYLLKAILASGDVAATDVKELIKPYEIGDKTLHEVKTTIGIKSVRRKGRWFWCMPKPEDKEMLRWDQ